MEQAIPIDVDADMILVIVHNSDGRPCGWGLAKSEPSARKEAERQYEHHKCYRDERRGKTVIHILPRKR